MTQKTLLLEEKHLGATSERHWLDAQRRGVTKKPLYRLDEHLGVYNQQRPLDEKRLGVVVEMLPLRFG